jgi:hypothetical protein
VERDVRASLDAIAEACSSIDANVRALIQTLIDVKVIKAEEFMKARENTKREKAFQGGSFYSPGSAANRVERLTISLLEKATKRQD